MNPFSAVLNQSRELQVQFAEQGFTTLPFPQELRVELLGHIDARIREFGRLHAASALSPDLAVEEIVRAVPDEVWSQKMARAFRILPKSWLQRSTSGQTPL